MTSTEEEIRKKAYQLWEDEGKPEGSADAHWEKAKLALIEGQPTSVNEIAPTAVAPPSTVEVPKVGTPPKAVLKSTR